MTLMSVPALYALSNGRTCAGPHRCYYCSAPCGTDHPASEYVLDSFTGRTEVPRPGSPWVCAGCVLCLRESCELLFIDGTRRTQTKAAVRGWSWLVTRTAALAAGKQHLARLRELCLTPPPAPWALVLSDSGKKHLLYRGVVNHDGPPWTVTLEGERVSYAPAELAALLAIAGRLCAATGKPALKEPPGPRLGMAYLERYTDGEEEIERWQREWCSPLGKLAAWLSPGRDDARQLYPASAPAPAGPGLRGVPAETGGADRPAKSRAGRGRAAGGARGGNPPLFDLGETVRGEPGADNPLGPHRERF